jgi:hypothetical protein
MNKPTNSPGNKGALTPHPAWLLLFALFIGSPLLASDLRPTHDLSVALYPESGEIEVEAAIRFDRDTTAFEFILNTGLSPNSRSGTLEVLASSDDGLRTAYRVTLETPGRVLKLHYHGRPVFSSRRLHGGMPQGEISTEGVYLDRASAWYPLFGGSIGALNLTLTLPDQWQAISIGRRSEQGGQVAWTSDTPHDELYLIAGPFSRHARSHGGIDLSVYLLDDDPQLATRYLDLMAGYIDHYSRLIGDYPYAKFAVVENRWQTGYGMPSFTLLGSRVLRLPFIPYTSLPHEILHNWWGNGVWVDYEKGNWSEGLTAYLADHWMKERRGEGAQYRLKALQRYSNYAAEGPDTPLLEFVSRHGDASQSIGYSKSLMLFHMLRQALGDKEFVTGLQRLWQEHRYTPIGFADAVETIVAADSALLQQFLPWLERIGAPRMQLGETALMQTDTGYRLELVLSQQQHRPFVFDVPVAVMLRGEQTARLIRLRMEQRQQRFALDLDRRPLRVDIDPQFDVLRILDPSEQPAALNRLFGGKTWLVLPSQAAAPMRDAWHALARQWQQRYPGLRTISDLEAETLDADANRLLLGWDNRLLDKLGARFAHADQTLSADAVSIRGQAYPRDQASVALVSNNAAGVATGFIGAVTPQAVATLARKLTHYGSYGRLVFDSESGQNLLKESLSPGHSVLSRQLGDADVPLKLPQGHALGSD